jgi:TetR/AcrR family transcriptional repressor of nem operon
VVGARDAPAALSAYLDFYLSPAHRDRRDRGCPLPALSADLPRLPPPSREAFGQGLAALTAKLARGLEAAGCAGPDVLASSLLSEMVGAVALSRAVADAVQSDRLLSDARQSIRERTGL